MEIKISIEAPALVDAINALAVAVAGNMELLLYNLEGQVDISTPYTVAEEPKAPAMEEPGQLTTAISLDDIRKAFIEKNKDRTNTPKLKALLAYYGVEKVTDLPEQHFAEILKKLEEF